MLSPQFQDLLARGDESPYRDFFIDWNRFWAGKGEMTPEGYIQPDPALIQDMFFRKPGLPILMVRMPDGSKRPYWNTFYQEAVSYTHLDVYKRQIRSSITICLFLAIVRSFMVFEVNMTLTDGGPFNSTEMIALRIYNRAFVSLKFGDAQAQAVVLFVIVAVISVLQAYFTSRREVQM